MRGSETLSGSALPSMSSLPEGTTVSDYNVLDHLLSTLNPLQSFTYDADGNLTHGYTPEGYVFTAEYDAEDRLTSLEYTDNSSVVHRTDYQYSGDDFLAVVKKYEDSALVDEIRIVRDGFLAVQERDGSNTVVREYTWGLNLGGGIGGLLNLKQGGADYFYLYDGKGNVEAVLDGSQVVVAAYRYDPFGKLLAKTGSLDQPFGFSTKRYDAQTGLIDYGFRRYAPAIGRWTTRDPLGEAGGINLYAFVGNNPVNWVDPWGLRVINESGNTLVIVINPILPDGTQGKQVLWHVPPGKDTDDMLPAGYDTDGIYKYGQLSEGYVYKILNGVTVIARDDGISLDVINSIPGGAMFQALEWFEAGWHDEEWVNEPGKEWPQPSRWPDDNNECQ